MIKILLVDDMRNFLDLEISFLRRSDCTIITAKDGLEALKLAKAEIPDIVLLDLEMPRMNGVQCCRFLKADPVLKNVPVVIVTALDKKTDCMKAGADDFVKKPINEDAFLREIKKFVSIKDRKERRIEVSIKVEYQFKKKSYSAYSRDLSLSGAFLITGDILPLGSEVPLTMELTDGKVHKKISALGKVVRVLEEATGDHAYTGMGLEFVDLKGKSTGDLKSYLKKMERTAPIVRE